MSECEFIESDKEGTSYCRLAESSVHSLKEQLEQSQQRVKELEEAYYSLKELTYLKSYKENIGKDENYLNMQPKSWARAYAAVNKIEGNQPLA